jgi:hypothetical protein
MIELLRFWAHYIRGRVSAETSAYIFVKSNFEEMNELAMRFAVSLSRKVEFDEEHECARNKFLRGP